MTLDGLIALHPLPWTRTPLSEGYKSLVIRDANDDSVCIRNTDETIVGAANLVGELRTDLADTSNEFMSLQSQLAAVTKERDEFEKVAISHAKPLTDLRAKCERLEADNAEWSQEAERLLMDSKDRRRHEAAVHLTVPYLQSDGWTAASVLTLRRGRDG